MPLPPPSLANVLSTWTADPVMIGVLCAAAAGYLLAAARLGRRGEGWPLARTLVFVVAGLGSVAVCTLSGLAVYDRYLLWPLAVQLTVLLTVCPALIAFGDPLGLLRRSLGTAGRSRYDAVAASRPVRLLTFPITSAVLAVVLQLGVLFSGFAGTAARGGGARIAFYLLALGVGCLFAVPMLGDDVLPAWCTPPIRLLFAGVDGLLDAIPGIAVVGGAGTIAGGYYAGVHRAWSTGVFTDREIAGGLMITFAETVAAPLVIALFVAWIRADERNAREVDVSLEAAAIVRQAAAPMAAPDDPDARPDRPWWEVDPGPLRDRAARYGWDKS